MASPAANGASASTPTSAGASSDQRLTLRLISPASDLIDFPPLVNVPVSSTIGRVKRRIEDELAARRRVATGLRLIYRGRVLDDDGKQLQDVFGSAAIQESTTQILHMVLRETVSSAATTAGNTATNAAPEQPARPQSNTPQGAPAAQVPVHHQLPQAQQADPLAWLPAEYREDIMRLHLESHAQLVERWRQPHSARVQAMQPPASADANQPTAPSTATPPQQRELLATEIEQMLAAAEARTASQGPPTAGGNVAQEQGGQGTAQGTAQGNRLTGNAEVYILNSPTGPRALLINENATYYSPPPPPQPTATFGNNPWVASGIQQHNHRAQPLQGQIMHQQLHHMQLLQQLQQRYLQLHLQNVRENLAATQQRQRQHHQQVLLAQQLQPGLRLRAPRQPEELQPAQPGQPPANAQHAPQAGGVPNVLRHAGLQANAGAGFLVVMWPHIWLVARLMLFIWWFTTPSASWWRWMMVILVAAAVFVANTGLLDGVANQAWAPVRRHIDELLPGVDLPGNGHGAQANGTAPQAATAVPMGRAGGRDPDPAEVAARMVAARQDANGERLMALARRLERVGIMFLASLAPGIAERHVARVEEEARAARWRQQQEAEAAAAAAAAAAEAAAAAAAAQAAAATTAAAATEEGKEAEAADTAGTEKSTSHEATRNDDEQ